MGRKIQGKWTKAPETMMKKEKARCWVRFTFSHTDLNKLKKVGMLSAVEKIKMPGNEIDLARKLDIG
jgi:hypothetical protein